MINEIMYYVWKSDSALADTYMHVSKNPLGPNKGKWITGEALLEKPKLLTLIGDTDSPAKLSDVVLTGFNLPVLSPRAIEVLKECGADNMEYFPVTIKPPKSKTPEKSYKIANIIGIINCLDKKHAKFTTFVTDPSEISYLSKYRILENKVLPQGRNKKAPLVFRLGEFRYHVLVHESIKTAFEKAGLTGSKFIPPKKFA